MSLELIGKDRISSVDCFRTIAVFLVILIHTNPLRGALHSYLFSSNSSIFEAGAEFVLGCLMVLAVPFFFTVAGYFFGRKILSGRSPVKTLKAYSGRLLIAWLFWQIVYFLTPSSKDFDGIIKHGYIDWINDVFSLDVQRIIMTSPPHLWFIPNLIAALSVITFFVCIKKDRIIIPVAILLYMSCLLNSTYQTILLKILANESVADKISYGLNLFRKMSCGYCESMLFVYCGWYLAAKNDAINLKRSLVFVSSGVIISCLEVTLLWNRFGITRGYLIGTVPLVVGIVMYSFSKPDIGKNNLTAKLGRYAFGIYLVHYLFVGLLCPVAALFEFPFSDIFYPLMIYVLSMFSAVMLSKNRLLSKVVV